jgi:hypothetical protein
MTLMLTSLSAVLRSAIEVAKRNIWSHPSAIFSFRKQLTSARPRMVRNFL